VRKLLFEQATDETVVDLDLDESPRWAEPATNDPRHPPDQRPASCRLRCYLPSTIMFYVLGVCNPSRAQAD